MASLITTSGPEANRLAVEKATTALAAAMFVQENENVVDTIAELRHIHAGVNKANKATADSSLAVVASIKELAASSAANKASIEELKGAINQSSKIASLQWAFSNADLSKFEYYDSQGHYYNQVQSGVLVRSILSWFIRGAGLYITTTAYIGQNDAAGKTAFQTKLVSTIHSLVGKKPRIDVESDGRAVIYYA